MCMTGHLHFAAEQQAREMRRRLEVGRQASRHPIIQRIRIDRKEHAIFRDGRILRVLDRPTRIPQSGKAGL